MSTKFIGKCQLCEAEGPLTFEHVPPRRVFNDRPAFAHTLEGLMIGTEFKKPPQVLDCRRGVGRHALCARCNGFTAFHYGEPFARWTYQCLDYARRVGDDNACILPFTIRPLEVLKQILTMGFAAA